MHSKDSSRDSGRGSGRELERFAQDCRDLAPEEFEERNGSAFLLLTASQLHDPQGPASTVVELGDASGPTAQPTAAVSVLAYPIQRTGRSVGHLITLGRTSNNDVVIPDQSISRFHAFLKESPSGDLQIQDAGSMNGTIVNGETVPTQGSGPAVDLKAGDTVRFGQVEVTYLPAKAFQEHVRMHER